MPELTPRSRPVPAPRPPGSGRTAPGGLEDKTANVRPYTVTGGRTHAGSSEVPIESLVECLGPPAPEHAPESRQILEFTSHQYLSVAELSAHLHLPVGVVRVLACDLADEGLLRVHGLTTTDHGRTPATTMSVLESVLDGISAL